MNNLVWFRNDLRVEDNHSLHKACQKTGKVIGVYFLDPRQFEMTRFGFKKTEKYRAKFLLESLRDLKNNLAQKNISLFIFHDLPENVIPKLVEGHHISTIFLQKEWNHRTSRTHYVSISHDRVFQISRSTYIIRRYKKLIRTQFCCTI